MTTDDWDQFCEWYNISGSIFLADRDDAFQIWQTVIAYLDMKKTEFKTKKKAQLEATADENRSEVIEWMKTQFLATAKAREILEDFENGKETSQRHQSGDFDTGERE